MSVAAPLHTQTTAPTPAVIEAQAVDVEEPKYVGLVTRLIAFGVDAGVINLIAVATGALVGLALSVVKIPNDLHKVAVAIGGFIYILWFVGYFVVFWSTTGQTPGNRLMRIRVVTSNGKRLVPRRALVRFVGLTLAALPLFLGYLWILVDNRRRGFQDLLARTVVVEAEPKPDE